MYIYMFNIMIDSINPLETHQVLGKKGDKLCSVDFRDLVSTNTIHLFYQKPFWYRTSYEWDPYSVQFI